MEFKGLRKVSCMLVFALLFSVAQPAFAASEEEGMVKGGLLGAAALGAFTFFTGGLGLIPIALGAAAGAAVGAAAPEATTKLADGTVEVAAVVMAEAPEVVADIIATQHAENQFNQAMKDMD